MKVIVTTLTFIGIIIVAVGYVKQLQQCPPPKIEYRYIPRTFKEEQNNPVNINDLYHTMFTKPTPWVGEIHSSPKNNEINRYFISQS